MQNRPPEHKSSCLDDPTLLIVEDEPHEMESLCAWLRGKGYEAVRVSSGDAALAALQTSEFALLLIDLEMPGIDGIALLRAAQVRDPDLVGIVMTRRDAVDQAAEAMKAGALDLIEKPFGLSALLAVLARALQARRLRRTNAELQRQLSAHIAEVEAKNRALGLANRELEAFSCSVSHDLRAPLRAIGSMSHVLREEYAAQLPPEGLRLLNAVTAHTARMNQLIDDLLRFARLNQHSLTRQSVDLSTLAQEVIAELRKQEGVRHVEVRITALPQAHADPALLRQVFANLLSNAFKFTRSRSQPLIEVGCDAPGESCVYFVRDNGAGFDMQHAERLFGVFQRLHCGEDFEGTGIGLSLVKRIIERHGGQVWARSEPNRGATFYFTLGGE